MRKTSGGSDGLARGARSSARKDHVRWVRGLPVRSALAETVTFENNPNVHSAPSRLGWLKSY
jgi:hypothetical protein